MADDMFPEALAMAMNAGDAKRSRNKAIDTALDLALTVKDLRGKLNQAIDHNKQWKDHCGKLQARLNALEAENRQLKQGGVSADLHRRLEELETQLKYLEEDRDGYRTKFKIQRARADGILAGARALKDEIAKCPMVTEHHKLLEEDPTRLDHSGRPMTPHRRIIMNAYNESAEKAGIDSRMEEQPAPR